MIGRAERSSIPVDHSARAESSITIWRRTSWSETIVGALVPLPIALFCLWAGVLAVMKSAGVAATMAVIGLAFGALAAWMIRRGIVIGRRYARVVGRWQAFTAQVDKSPAFYDELFRRSGLAAPPIP